MTAFLPARRASVMRPLLLGRRMLRTHVPGGPVDAPALIAALTKHHQEAAEREVKWFVDNMPSAYFRQVPERSQERHLRAITALAGEDIAAPEVRLTDLSEDGTAFDMTFLSAGSGKATPEHVLRQLEENDFGTELRRVLLFTSADGRLTLNTFSFAADATQEPRFGFARADKEHFPAEAANAEVEAAAKLELQEYVGRLSAGEFVGMSEQHVRPSRTLLAEEDLDNFLKKCSSRYVSTQLPRLLFRQFEMYQKVNGGDESAVHIEHNYEPNTALITLALPGVPPRQALWRALSVLNIHRVGFLRAQVDNMRGPTVNPTDETAVTLLRTSVVQTPTSGEMVSPDWDAIRRDMKFLKWLDDGVVRLAGSSNGALNLVQAEVASGLAGLALTLLDHPLLSIDTIHERLARSEALPHACSISDLFCARFDPAAPIGDAPFHEALEGISTEIDKRVSDDETRSLLHEMARAVKCTVRTNVHLDRRWALALRLDPTFFEPILPPSPNLSNLPYGVFHVAGRHFKGFHVRFADIARGGLRVVLPPNDVAHVFESRRHFLECFGLAWAQQLKNKDIAEGGSKGVCLVKPVNHVERADLLHKCVKRMTDGLLDLMVEPEVGGPSARVITPSAIDADGEYTPPKPEVLYLGPDENITPTDIEWIAERAAVRGYGMPAAFMSSKPRAGINHKEYGVTSEGVAVFLEEALRSVQIDPQADTWSVKLTGGPDGDVAGNMLKILDRDYGDRVRVVGMADGTGCAEDPNGLPMGELLRLFERGEPLSALNRETMGHTGVLTLADTPTGAAWRNSMHNRVVADAFVPAGGRPATINATNWEDFLQEDGTPSAKVVVEGANLFLTADARLALFERCSLPIVKDSSANKCGVICSSLEIVASMTLSSDEFVDLKTTYVNQTLERLRDLARQEAQLLFDESKANLDTPLPALSERISLAILRASQALGGQLDEMHEDQQGRLWPLVREQLPPCLFERHASRLPERVPWEYQSAMISSGLASRLVYREGLSFCESLSDARLPSFALRYLQQEQVVKDLARQVESDGAPYASKVKGLLLRGGVRAATETPLPSLASIADNLSPKPSQPSI